MLLIIVLPPDRHQADFPASYSDGLLYDHLSKSKWAEKTMHFIHGTYKAEVSFFF